MQRMADERYLKTTLYGLSGCAPDYVMLMVGGNAGMIGMSKVSHEPHSNDRADEKEHLGVAMALNVPVAICVTKIDMTPPNILEQTINMLVKVLKSPGSRYVHMCIEGRGLMSRRIPVFVENAQQAVDCARFLGQPLEGASSGRYVPSFSCTRAD
jgi:GTPase